METYQDIDELIALLREARRRGCHEAALRVAERIVMLLDPSQEMKPAAECPPNCPGMWPWCCNYGGGVPV